MNEPLFQPRPISLAEIARHALQTGHFGLELADFLHEFGREGKPCMLAEPPELLQGQIEKGAIFDAYLAAVAVSLSARIAVPSPAWSRQPERILREPWFASPGHHMRALLLLESPAAFRERNLFVTANAISVA